MNLAIKPIAVLRSVPPSIERPLIEAATAFDSTRSLTRGTRVIATVRGRLPIVNLLSESIKRFWRAQSMIHLQAN